MPHMQQILEARHSDLQRRLDAEQSRRHPDDVIVASIKKQKLAVKDVLAHH